MTSERVFHRYGQQQTDKAMSIEIVGTVMSRMIESFRPVFKIFPKLLDQRIIDRKNNGLPCIGQSFPPLNVDYLIKDCQYAVEYFQETTGRYFLC